MMPRSRAGNLRGRGAGVWRSDGQSPTCYQASALIRGSTRPTGQGGYSGECCRRFEARKTRIKLKMNGIGDG
ncbi:MAG UNVERIFIED_CONTAM: hypothetical protein LVT10_06005 [Anaerolineae bacterium]